jgi:PadR family transcriptional regulator, regulatory protein PadR
VKQTRTLIAVAVALMADPFGTHWGYALGRQAHVRSGVLYPILRRMLNEGWLTDGWEDPSEAPGRPPRRYYGLTDEGRRELGSIALAGTPVGGLRLNSAEFS